jgi:class 3 adenylate cyclase/tetratricopeptide (TPR) repeat protein
MSDPLTPYVPRLVLEWARDTPEASYRAIDGTLVFCDVSGFTALSERLARLGKLGAEELTDILNTVFSELLAKAANFGGSMLKYGGDAVLVFFWGDGHARRATAAAAAMRGALRVVGKGRSSAGRVSLRMSVGINSGAFDFFLVGDAHRELIVAGPAATITCDMEASADAGQILMSAATAEALPGSCRGRPQGKGYLLARAPHEQPAAAAGPDGNGFDAGTYVPGALRSHLGAGGVAPEHRHVAVGFLGFGHLDRLLATEGGAAAAAALHRLVTIVEDRFDAHGVTFLASDIYGDGGKIIAVAGAPSMHENNDERMLRAMREIVDGYTDLPLHVGLNRGSVFTGDVGPSFRRTYTMLGDAVNTAARVMAKAAEGEIRTMPAVLDRSATVFDVIENEPFAAKGKKEPLVTFSVGAIAGQRAATGDRIPLVGREAELDLLLAVSRDPDPNGTVVELVGEAGIGKTRLLEEFVATIDVPVLVARCELYESSTPFFAARQLVQAALGASASAEALEASCERVAPDLLPWLPLLAAVLGVTVASTPAVDQLDPSAYLPRLHATITDLLSRTLETGAAIVVDDTQWLDAASAAYLDVLAESAGERAWTLVLSRRPQDEPAIERDRPAKLITLLPLTIDAGVALVQATAPRVLLPGQAARLAERGGGHPLFVQELARAALTDSGTEALPETVDAMIAARIDTLPPRSRDRLRGASVLGIAFDHALLRDLVGDAHLDDLAEFIEVSHDGVRFRQAMFQQAAYDALPYRRRRELHAKVAELIEARGGEEAERLSLHFFEAQRYAEARNYALDAGARAEARSAYIDAVTFYERAVQAGRRISDLSPTDRAHALKELGRMLVHSGRRVEAMDAYRRAQAMASADPVLMTRLALNRAELFVLLGRLDPALRWLRRGLATIETTADIDPILQCRASLTMARLLLHKGSRDSLQWAAEAIDRANVAGLVLEEAHGYATLGVAQSQLGEDHLQATARALELYRMVGNRTGEGMMENNLGVAAYYAGDWALAAARYARAADAHEGAGLDTYAANTRINLGELLLSQGRVEEAATAFEDAASVFETSQGYEMAYVQRGLARARARRADLAGAHRLLDEASATFETLGAGTEMAQTYAARAFVYLLGREPAHARSAADEAETASPEEASSTIAWLRACAAAQEGMDAVALFEAARDIAREAHEPYDEALCNDALAQLLDGPDATKAAAEAAAAFERLGVVDPGRVPLA